MSGWFILTAPKQCCGRRFLLCVGSNSHFRLPLCIDLMLDTGSADSSVPIPVNKSWNIQDLSILFLAVRQLPCLLSILSLSRRECNSAPPCLLPHKCLLLFPVQVSPLMFSHWHDDPRVCRPVIVFVRASQGPGMFWLPSLEAPLWQANRASFHS